MKINPKHFSPSIMFNDKHVDCFFPNEYRDKIVTHTALIQHSIGNATQLNKIVKRNLHVYQLEVQNKFSLHKENKIAHNEIICKSFYESCIPKHLNFYHNFN